MLARHRMEEYGTTEEQMAKVAVKSHKNSVHNENARYRKEFSLEQVLGSAALMRRDQVVEAVDVAHRRLEPEEAPRPRVRLIAQLHGGTLLLRQRGRSAVREEIDEHIVGTKEEGVVARLLQCAPPPVRRRQGDRLDDLDLPRRRRHI